jgi:cytochrome c oxidase subunit 2
VVVPVSRRRLAALALVTGTVAIASCSGSSPSMLDARGNEAKHVETAWWIMFGLALAVYVLVATFILIAVVRGRRTTHGKGSRIPDNAFVWFGGIIMPAVVLIVIGVVTVGTTAALRLPSKHPLRVDVIGHDWWWEVRYPGTPIRTANEFHLPTGTPIEVRLTTDDVIHSFWVPQIGGKVDLIPGQPNYFRFTIEQSGVYRGQCAEYCGLQHANMALYVHADPPGLYERWMSAHTNAPDEPASELAAAGAVAFQAQPCSGCHTIRGTQAQGTVGPDLSDFGSRRSIGAGAVSNDPAELAGWIHNAQHDKPGARMPPLSISKDDVKSIVAYLESLR